MMQDMVVKSFIELLKYRANAKIIRFVAKEVRLKTKMLLDK